MAYRGGGSSRGAMANNGLKRSNPSPTLSSKSGSAFESQFAELASYNSPSTKRQRTNSGAGAAVKSGPGSCSRLPSAASKKSPLKFDFKPTRKPNVSLMQPPSEDSRPKVIHRPMLPSQKAAQPPIPPQIDDEDWGDDDVGCEDPVR